MAGSHSLGGGQANDAAAMTFCAEAMLTMAKTTAESTKKRDILTRVGCLMMAGWVNLR